jgi:antitoxin (DNA-binding transcriptional repressor) of toxin-antitoxin stability system
VRDHEDAAMTQFIKTAEFEANCLALVDEVARTGEGVVITKDGKPIADLVPHLRQKKHNARGIWKDKVIIKGDIISPLDVEWNALK